jgi:hypothetical protein
MSKRTPIAASLVSAALVAAALVHLARASAPATMPVYYGGYLEENGQPAAGPRTLQINLWDDPASSDASAHLRCFYPPTLTPLDSGRFRIALPDSCGAALAGGAPLFVEVIVDDHPMPRAPVGGIPFAMRAQQVSFAGITDLDTTTEWPGGIPYSRVLNAPDVAALQARVAALEARRPVLVNPATGAKYSLDALYCGATAPTTGILFESVAAGYGAAKLRCERVCGTPTAHMCTAEELMRHLQTGGAAPPNPGWYAAGVAAQASGATVFDCDGFTSNLHTQYGLQFQAAPGLATCDTLAPINCCD